MKDTAKESLRIIDFKINGSAVEFLLGSPDEKGFWTIPGWKAPNGYEPEPSKVCYGDDWDDRPYEHNAGPVYEQFVKGRRILHFGYGDAVLEPRDGELNSEWSKDDMRDRKVPCVIIVPHGICNKSGYFDDSFDTWVGADGVIRIYMGDRIEDVLAKTAALR